MFQTGLFIHREEKRKAIKNKIKKNKFSDDETLSLKTQSTSVAGDRKSWNCPANSSQLTGFLSAKRHYVGCWETSYQHAWLLHAMRLTCQVGFAHWAMTVPEASNQFPVGVRLVSQEGTHSGLCKPGQNPKAGKVME